MSDWATHNYPGSPQGLSRPAAPGARVWWGIAQAMPWSPSTARSLGVVLCLLATRAAGAQEPLAFLGGRMGLGGK